jgi:predicted nucleotidyltransferase
MTRAELLEKLRDLKPWLEEQGIVNVRLFGSYARDEAGPDSDVDLLVDETRTLSYFDLFDIKESLTHELHRPVEICPDASLTNPYIRRTALRDAIAV